MTKDLVWLVLSGVSVWLMGPSLLRLFPMVFGGVYLTSFLMKLGDSGLIDGQLLYWVVIGVILALALWGLKRNGLPFKASRGG